MTTPPRAQDESWTQVGSDLERLGLYAVMIPGATQGPKGIAFWFQQFAGRTKRMNESLVDQLLEIGEVFLVVYIGKGGIVRSVTDKRTGETWKPTRAELDDLMKSYGTPKPTR